MKSRNFSINEGRYGFNGKEKDDEVHGSSGTSYDFGARIYDPRLGRFLRVDPLSLKFTMLSTYQYASNNPIYNIDIDGLEGYPASGGPYVTEKPNHNTQWFPIDKATYDRVKRWYETKGMLHDETVEKPNGYRYIYTPYKDPLHPETIGMGTGTEGNCGCGGNYYMEKIADPMKVYEKFTTNFNGGTNEPSKSQLEESYEEVVDKIANMAVGQNIKIVISSSTNQNKDRSAEYIIDGEKKTLTGAELANQRSLTIKKALLEKGVKEDQITIDNSQDQTSSDNPRTSTITVSGEIQ